MNGDQRLFLNFLNKFANIFRRVGAVFRIKKGAGITAQLGALFHQGGFKSLICERNGRREAGEERLLDDQGVGLRGVGVGSQAAAREQQGIATEC